MTRLYLLTVAISFIALASGCCCNQCGGRPLASYNYNPVYPTAYAPQSGCNSCGAVAPF